MSSGALKKPPAQGSTAAGPRSSVPGGGLQPSRSPSRPSTPPANGLAKSSSSSSRRGANGSPVSARAAVKRPTLAPSSLRNDASSDTNAAADDEDARIEHAGLIEDLKERLAKSETAQEEFKKQVVVLQTRLDESNKEQIKLEDRLHEEEEKMELVENEKKEALRQRRELDSIYEAERVSVMKDKEESQGREDELLGVIQRLKDSIAQKDSRSGSEEDGRSARTSTLSSSTNDSSHFAPPSSIQRSNSRNNSKLILQKDKLIESLRLELAEAQLKLAEMGNMGGTRITELEGKLVQARMANARLMEENESFQVLLSERTLNGDFSAGGLGPNRESEERTPPRGRAATSLADELEGASPSTDFESDAIRKLEAELQSSKDSNKALSLYINKIIERLLQHQGFESVLSNTQEGPHGSGHARDVDRPPTPPPKDRGKENDAAGEGQSFLQRARSVVAGPNKIMPRPASLAPERTPTLNENPNTAPSIPLKPSGSAASTNKRMSTGGLGLQIRSTSGNTIPGAAGIVNNMYKPSADQISPGIASPTRPGLMSLNISGAGGPSAPSRLPSGSALSTPPPDGIPEGIPEDDESDARAAAFDALTGGTSAADVDGAQSPARSLTSQEGKLVGREQNVIGGRQIRPLRLLQKNTEAVAAEEARLRANRGSWIGGVTNWFNKNQQPGQDQQQGGAAPHAYSQPQPQSQLQQTASGAEGSRHWSVRNVS